MMRLRFVFGAALAMAMLAGCGRPGTLQPGAAGGQLTSAPIDAALVSADFGWVLTTGQLLLTSDGGASFQVSKVDLGAGEGKAAFFSDAQHGWVAAVSDPLEVTVARTSDGGNSWQYTKIKTPEPVARLSIGFGGQAQGGLLAKMQTSNAFSRGFFYATTDGGTSWSATGEAPAAGQIAVEPDGRVWLAGGVVSDQLYASRDLGRTWTQPVLDMKPTMVGLPSGGLLPVMAGEGTVALLSTADAGASWHPSATFAGEAAALAVYGQVVMIADPAGRLHRGDKSAVKSIGAQGLPAGVSRLSLGDESHGWALASTGQCDNGKKQCSLTYTLVATDDGGDSWKPLLRFQERIG